MSVLCSVVPGQKSKVISSLQLYSAFTESSATQTMTANQVAELKQ